MILITGASGHLGANLAWALATQGAPLRVLLRPGTDRACLEGIKAEVTEGSVTDFAACERAMRGIHQAYHCAAQISTHHRAPDDIFQTNVIGTANILRAAAQAGVDRVVVTGSLSATGHRADRPTDESELFNPLESHLPYAFTKAAVEHECLRAAAEGQNVVIAVSCAILGPRDFKPSRMGSVLIRFARRRLLAYVPGGFEFVAARDIVQGHLLAMERGERGQKYIFSTRFANFDEIMAIFAEVTGQPKPPLRLPPNLMKAVAHIVEPAMTLFLPGMPQLLTPAAIRLLQMGRRADCAKASDRLGYRPTDLGAAIEEAYGWFVERGVIALPKRHYAVSRGHRP
jgi:3beta-hydroxysteroid-4beta-carboxylate 3-dehydrogenase (decarboxylating)